MNVWAVTYFSEQSSEAALQRLASINSDTAQVAILLADLWMPEMTGIAFLEQAHALHPHAKRLLLINWGDGAATAEIVQAVNIGWIEPP